MKKKLIKLFVITLFCVIGMDKVFASSVGMSASSYTVTRGNTATITTTISADSGIYTIEGSMSCSGAGVSGGKSLAYEDMNTSSKSKSFNYTIKPTSSGTVTCSTSNVMLRELKKESNYSIGSKSLTIKVVDPVVVPEKEYSSVNTLKSLSVEGFKLDKDFNKDTLEYNVEVPNDTKKVNIKASVTDENASVKGAGEREVNEGVNKLEVKVTAENGNVKTYIINVTVKELDPINVKVDGKDYLIIRKEGVIDAPSGFDKTSVKIDDQDVLAYTNNTLGYTLIGLKDKDGKAKYYVYDNGKYSEFVVLEAKGFKIVVLDFPKDKLINGYIESEFEVNETKYIGYVSNKQSKYYLVYGKNYDTGIDSIYQYDSKDGTLQRLNLEKFNTSKTQSNYKIPLIIVSIILGLVLIGFGVYFIISNRKKDVPKLKVKKSRKSINY